MPFTLDRALNSTGGSAFDLAKKIFLATVLNNFTKRVVAWNLTTKTPLMGAKQTETIALADLTASSHAPGTDIDGQNLSKAKRQQILEDEETIAIVHESIVDGLTSHYAYSPEVARKAGEALARTADSHILQNYVLGARTAASGDFKGGSRVQRAGATVAAAYPVSTTGSTNLQSDLAALAQVMDEKDVPKDDRYVFITPYLHRVLRQDNTLLSIDYVDRALADKMNRKLMKVEGFWVLETNNMPATDTSAATSPKKYGAAVYGVNALLTAAVAAQGEAVTTVHAGGIRHVNDWVPQKRVTMIGAAILKGHDIRRPECCGELHISGV